MNGYTLQIGNAGDASVPGPVGVSWVVVLIGSCIAVAVSLIVFAQLADAKLLLAGWLAFSYAVAFWAGSSWSRSLRRRYRATHDGADGAHGTEHEAAYTTPVSVPIYRYAARRSGMFGLFAHRY